MEGPESTERIQAGIGADSPPSALSAELRAQLDSRLNEYLAAPNIVIPWDAIKARYETP
jgi:putative addiction module component (TIGR02574 family)